ncbi:LysR substrate-binding domain-containing protein [Rhodococcus sp. BE178]|uniref:LysR substrate-binding domain-containing protein n=1 Tax=Rhodococcus sp. BE178 TaxID=2817737 RepID=UPI003D1BC244
MPDSMVEPIFAVMESRRLLDGRLKLRHLLLVDLLSSRGSVVGAAAALHVTQPVVTRSLQELERILGVELYERGHRGIQPTEAGAVFTDYARSVLAQLRQAARHLDEIQDATRGYVVIGTHLAGSNLLLPRAVARLKGERPMLRVVIREGSPEFLLEELAVGTVDLIVGRVSGPTPEGMTRRVLYSETVKVVTRLDHPLTERATVTLEDLLPFVWILPGVETMLRTEIEAYFARNGYPLPPNSVDATAFLTVRQLLIETDMITVLPGLLGTLDPRLTTLPISFDQVGANVGVTLASDRHLNPASRAMLDTLVEVARSMQDESRAG